MGKGILIVVLGVGVTISILIMNLNANVHQSLDATLNYLNNSQARLIANSGIEIWLTKMRLDKDLKGSFNNNSLLNGSYNITIYGPDTALNVKSVATFNAVTHTSKATARRRPLKIPTVNSALYISSNTLDLNLNGNVDINGNDHLMSGAPGTAPSLPGVGVDSPADSAFIIHDVQPKITREIVGVGTAPSIRSVPDEVNWVNLAEEYIYSADTILHTGTYSSGSQFGTATNPIITYCSGVVEFTAATGYGVMVINGELKLSGNFIFYGLVIVYGESQISVNTIGNNSIYGATILAGPNVAIDSKGNAEFYYCYQALQNAKMNLKSSRFEVLTWWE